MALAHNGLIRALNSMYLQAPHIPLNDQATIKDFLIYAQCWGESMEHHHHSEENIFFPSIEQLTGVPGIMEQNKEQHRAFTPGFERLYEYARTCASKDFDGNEFRSLIEGFAEPLHKHLEDEIATLRALDKYDSQQVRQAYRRLEKELMNTDNVSYLKTWPKYADSPSVPNRRFGLLIFRQIIRRRDAQFPSRTVLRALDRQPCVHAKVSWCLAIRSMYCLQRA
jgi:hemerythrin-like domain-containing protein